MAVEGFTAVLLWLADIQVFEALFPLLLLSTLFLFIVISCVLIRIEKRKEKALKEFLLNSDRNSGKALLDAYGPGNREIILFLTETFYQKQAEIETAVSHLADYEDYIELWAHEIKLPLSLLTLILDNQGDSLPQDLSFKLDYIRNQIQNHISRILFYHRVKSERKDYFFEELNVESCIDEILKDYAPLIHESGLKITLQDLDYEIYTDRRSFEFIIGQMIANALKYSGDDPCLDISMVSGGDRTILTLKDNGQGVKACDLPYIFAKGFTGDSGDVRKKSSGMGLYLVKQLADDLGIDLEASSEWQSGFSITLSFPN
ncbi:MAG: sensor histidine kinase [Bacillota bacterium]|nr:sensor histidine kinase [Bacillota bacterium]